MKKPSINKKNKIIFISTIVGLLIVAIGLALSVKDSKGITNAEHFWVWSTNGGIGSVMWVVLIAVGVWGGLYAIWNKIKEK